MERVPQHDGSGTVLEMLNRPQQFFAFRPDPGTELMLVAKAHTVSVSLDRQAPIADPARLSAAKLLGIEAVLAGGTTLSGWASAELPPENSRLLDYLNASHDPFFARGRTPQRTTSTGRTCCTHAPWTSQCRPASIRSLTCCCARGATSCTCCRMSP